MGLQTESVEVFKRPGNNTGVGTTVFTVDSTQVKAVSPVKMKQDDNVIHDKAIVNITVLAATVDMGIFSPVEGVWKVDAVMFTNRVVGSDGSAVTADIMACDATEAPASGVTQLSSANAIDLKATVDTPTQVALATSPEEVGPGKYFGLNVQGTLTAVVSCITVQFKRIR